MKTTNSLLPILTLATVLAMPVHAQTFLTNGLVAFYPFNGNANDVSGNGYNGIVQGATLAANRFGVSNSAYVFDGVQSRIQIPENIFGATASAFTVSLWVATDNGPYTGIPVILEKSGHNGAFTLQINSNQFQFAVFHSNHTSSGASSPMISNSVTQLVGVYQQGQGVWLYTNGVLASSVTNISNLTLWVDTSGYQLVSAVGIYDWTPAPYDGFRGVIDDVRVYTRAFSASEVQQLYQYESASPTPPVIASFAPVSGPAGTNVTIAGLNFNPVASNNIVYFGAVRATVTAASPTNLTVTVPVGATYAPITETVNGLTAYSDQPFLPTFPGNGQINSSLLGSQIVLPTGTRPAQVVIADLDGDGLPDLIIADGWGDVSIYQNISSNGTLALTQRVVLPGIQGTFDNPRSVAVADIDGDGKPDIVALNGDSNIVSIYRNLSAPGILTSNSFAPRIDFPAGNAMRGLAVQDLNGDGKPDIVTGNQGDNTISIFQNQSIVGNILFAPRVNLSAGNGPTGVAIGDLDGDGEPDIAVANSDAGVNTISVFRNLGGGGTITTNSFAPQVVFPSGATPLYLAIGDLDGNGRLDIVTANGSQGLSMSVLRNLTTGPGITTSSFASHVDFALGGWGHTVALGDLSGDGKPDVTVVTELNSLLSIFHNVSTPGSFTTSSLGSRVDFSSGYNAWGVSVGDLDGDGRPDIVFANTYDNTISIYLNTVPSPTPPKITSQPQDAYVDAYGTASFSVGATGASSYHWLFNGSNVLSAASSNLVIPNVVQSELGTYSAIVGSSFGSVTSSAANLYMYPTIITPFAGLVTDWGQNITLSVDTWGSGALTFQWYDNGIAIPNATNSTLTFPAIQFTNAGSYSVVVSSSLGNVTNAPAQLVVNPSGVSLGLYPGLTITGTVGYTYIIQSNPDLTNTNGWTTVATLTLWQPTQFWVDVNNNAASPTNQHRFYRILPGQ